MNKYDSLKFFKETKARNPHHCDKCDQNIEKGEVYWKESVGKVNAPGLMLRGFCAKCYQQYSNQLPPGKF